MKENIAMDNLYNSLDPWSGRTPTSSADALLLACEKLVWDGTDLSYIRLDNIAQKLQGVNDNLAAACLKAHEVIEKMNLELSHIVRNIQKNIETFAEASKLNEQQATNVLDNVNSLSESILSELGLDKTE